MGLKEIMNAFKGSKGSQKNREVATAIFFNKDLGYIFCPICPSWDNLGLITQPAIRQNSNISNVEIANCITESLEHSRSSRVLEASDSRPYWLCELTGIKTKGEFNKTFDYLECVEDGDGYKLIVLDDRFESTTFTFEKSDSEGLGNKVVELFSGIDRKEDDGIRSFETITGSVVTYSRPSLDYEDMGDYHTDAYQMYIYGSDRDTYLGFMIDLGYEGYTVDAVKNYWGRYMKNGNEVVVEEITGGQNYLHGIVNTDASVREVYIFKDKDMVLEVSIEIPSNNPELYTIKKEFERVISTIRIS